MPCLQGGLHGSGSHAQEGISSIGSDFMVPHTYAQVPMQSGIGCLMLSSDLLGRYKSCTGM